MLAQVSVSPRLLGAYLERRASGHAWIDGAGRLANRVLNDVDRDFARPPLPLPTWAGAHVRSASPPERIGRAVTVASIDDFARALAAATPGDTIVLAAGEYRFTGKALGVDRPGTASAPITVRAESLGSARLQFDMLEGFRVTAPYWRFENLQIDGACARHDDCEHAFHVVGNAHHTVIRNNLIRDFNAHIKINGAGKRFPDLGEIVDNTLTNRAARRTSAPVTPIDAVGASRWRVEGNLITDFAKEGGDLTSYGAFFKGAGTHNRFLRNVVLCEWQFVPPAGRRVGLSFGGGGSNPSGCRDDRCVVEHDEGVMAANLIASCSDAGVYINRAARSRLNHNTLLDTAGIEVRFDESTATLSGNLVDGPLRVRDGATAEPASDHEAEPAWALYLGQHPVRELFVSAAGMDLRFKSDPEEAPSADPTPDLCTKAIGPRRFAGAFDAFDTCTQGRTPAHPAAANATATPQ